MRIILLGAPGSGKGSVGKPLGQELDLPVISTGDIFRQNIRDNTKLGEEAKSYMDKGELVPDGVTIGIIEERLKRFDCSKGFILDGFPRTILQAQALERIISDMGCKMDFVLNVELSDEIIIKRLSNRRVCAKCGETYNALSKKPANIDVCDICGGNVVQRDDDREETVKKRLDTYYTNTLPLVDYYKKIDKLISIDNDCSIEEGLLRALNAATSFAAREN